VLKYIIILSADSTERFEEILKMLKPVFKELDVDLYKMNRNTCFISGPTNPIRFISDLWQSVQHLEWHTADEISICYPSINRIELNLFPDIEEVYLKQKGSHEMLNPFRLFVTKE